MKQKTILILFTLLIPVYFYAQTPSTNNSLYQTLNNKINFTKSTTSDIVWGKIQLPEGKELRSFKVLHNNDFYIGCSNGGFYKYNNETWELIGLSSSGVYDFEEYLNGELIVGSLKVYLWDEIELSILSDTLFPFITKTYDYFFGSNAFGDLARSTDGCLSWVKVKDFPSSEALNGIVATTSDSVFLGTTKFTGNGGGVYISIDSGNSWNHFGLYEHFIASMAVDNNNHVYAGNNGHYETGQGGLYRYNYETEIWDSLFYFPYITSIVFNTENYIFTGFNLSGMSDAGGVMHSEDDGETWILDTTGMGNTMVNELQIDNNGFLYALTGYTTKKLYRTILPVNINENNEFKNQTTICFPNPVNNNLTVNFFPEKHNNGVSIFTMYNISGIKALERGLTKNEMETGIIRIDVSSLNKGFYIYKIQSENYITSNKFIKQ